MRTESHAFSGLAAWNDEQFNLTRAGEPELVVAASVNADFLRVLGVEPMLGRDFDVSQDRPGNDRFVLLGYQLWQRHFGGDPNAAAAPGELPAVPTGAPGATPGDPPAIPTGAPPAAPDHASNDVMFGERIHAARP